MLSLEWLLGHSILGVSLLTKWNEIYTSLSLSIQDTSVSSEYSNYLILLYSKKCAFSICSTDSNKSSQQYFII